MIVGPGEIRDRGRQSRLLVLALLCPLHVLLLGWIACRYSPTADEAAHLAAGVRIWKTGKFDAYTVNPPLVKMVAALPVILDPPKENWDRFTNAPGERPEWLLGLDYMWTNAPRFRWDFVVARWACIPFSLLGMVYCARWGNVLFGAPAGVLAAALWCFSPNILGNGALVTPDVAATSLGLATMYHFRGWLITKSWRQALLAGVFLGLAELSKMTWLILYPLLPALWMGFKSWERWQGIRGQERWSESAVQLAVLLLLSVDLLNSGYLFQESFRPLGEFQFVSESLAGHCGEEGWGNRFQQGWLASLPVPVPASFVRGLDLQRRDFEGGWRPMYSYLAGEHRLGGWWYYYLYGLGVKVPLGLYFLCLGLVFWRASRAAKWHELILLLAAPIMLFVFVSSQTGFSRSFRYVLPCFPFAFVLLGSLWSAQGGCLQLRPMLWGSAGLLMFCCASLSVYPHSLAFFNSLAGGPSEGHRYLLDSNLDWGQDLYSLRDWQLAHPDARPLHLAYAGVAEPKLFGITAESLTRSDETISPGLEPGWYALSANHLHGYDSDAGPWAPFSEMSPTDRAGYSILIYHLTEEQN